MRTSQSNWQHAPTGTECTCTHEEHESDGFKKHVHLAILVTCLNLAPTASLIGPGFVLFECFGEAIRSQLAEHHHPFSLSLSLSLTFWLASDDGNEKWSEQEKAGQKGEG
jgi:flagellar biosynthesis protein FliP